MGSASEQVVTRAVKLRIDAAALTDAQRELLDRHAGTARAVWNWALATRNQVEDERRQWLRDRATESVSDGDRDAVKELLRDSSWIRAQKDHMPTHLRAPAHAATLDKQFTALARDPESRFSWWHTEKHGVSRYAVSTPLRELDAAFTRFFADTGGYRTRAARRLRKDGRPAGWPRFKKKGRATPAFALFNLGQAGAKPWLVIDGGHRIVVPNIGSLRVHQDTKKLRRMISRGGIPKSVRFTMRAGHWDAVILVSLPAAAEAPVVTTRAQRATGVIGVDLGVRTLAAISTGEEIPNPRHTRRAAATLARLQRHQARQQGPRHPDGPSKGWVRTGRRIAALLHKTAVRRSAHLHEITKRLTTSAETIAIEDLNVRGMSASTSPVPDPDTPGRWLPNGRAAKSGLNRSILDAGFAEFRRQLEYKAPRYGSQVVVVPRFAPTSKICSVCGAAKATLRLSERIFRCGDCGLVLDRDLNAARNIAALARQSPPSGGDSKRPDANVLITSVVGALPGKTAPPGAVAVASNGPPVPTSYSYIA